MTALALPVVVLALMLAATWLSAAAIYPVWGRVSRVWRSAARWTPVVVTIPLWLGAAVGLAGVLPWDPHLDQVLGCHCASSMPQWSHLCPTHPEQALGFVPLAGMVIAGLGWHRVRALRAVLGQPPGEGGSTMPRVVDLPVPLAMLHGWLRPTLVVDKTLWTALRTEHREALLAHERAHLERRDPLVLWLLQLMALFGPAVAGRSMVRAWLEHAELAADAVAARSLGDPLVLADALIQSARLTRPHSGSTPTLSWTGGVLESRVMALLDPSCVAQAPAWSTAQSVTLAVLAATTAWAAPLLHHQVEHLLNLAL